MTTLGKISHNGRNRKLEHAIEEEANEGYRRQQSATIVTGKIIVQNQ